MTREEDHPSHPPLVTCPPRAAAPLERPDHEPPPSRPRRPAGRQQGRAGGSRQRRGRGTGQGADNVCGCRRQRPPLTGNLPRKPRASRRRGLSRGGGWHTARRSQGKGGTGLTPAGGACISSPPPPPQLQPRRRRPDGSRAAGPAPSAPHDPRAGPGPAGTGQRGRSTHAPPHTPTPAPGLLRCPRSAGPGRSLPSAPPRLTREAAPFAVSAPALEQEERVGPLRDPQSAGQQHLLGPQPHRGGAADAAERSDSARRGWGRARPERGGGAGGSGRAPPTGHGAAPAATAPSGGPAPSLQRGGARLPPWRWSQGRGSARRRSPVRGPPGPPSCSVLGGQLGFTSALCRGGVPSSASRWHAALKRPLPGQLAFDESDVLI